jgi:hypothetical protein
LAGRRQLVLRRLLPASCPLLLLLLLLLLLGAGRLPRHQSNVGGAA